MNKQELIIELEKIKYSLCKFLKHYKYDKNKLKNHPLTRKISEKMELEFKVLLLELEKEELAKCNDKLLLENKELINNSFSKLTSTELNFVPCKGEFCFFWNSNSQNLIIGKYDYSAHETKNKVQLHYLDGSFKKGFQNIAPVDKKLMPKDFFKIYYTSSV